MLNISDILEIMALCAILFVPVGYVLHNHFPKLRALFRRMILRKKLIISDGYLKKIDKNESGKHD